MSDTVSDHIIERLEQWGVHRIYGYPGDGINGLMGALRRHEDSVRFVQSRHEELAAFMACAEAKFTGRLGVCLATSGPGAIHLLNGLYDAAKDHQPVLAIVGQQAQTAIGSDYQQEVDLVSLYKDVAHNFVHVCTHPAQAQHLIDRAARIAMADRTVTCIIVPNDVQEMDAMPKAPRTHGAVRSALGWRPPQIVPADDDIEDAANLLNSGERVAMLVGAGALRAQEEVMEVAEVLGAGVAKALLGRACLDDALPYVTGPIGLLGSESTDKMMKGCDRLLMVGTSFPYSEWLPKEGQARGVQIDIKPRMLGARFSTDVNLCGDAKLTLRALLPHLKRKTDRHWREKIEGWRSEWDRLVEERAMKDANPINPQRIFHELNPMIPERCVITADSGSSANWWARNLKIRPGMMASLSGNLATMGPAVPYSIAAKFAHPDRPVIAFVGDGAMQMNGLNGLITIKKYFEQWSNRQLVIVVLNNRDLNQVTWEQRVMEGDPKFDASQTIPEVDYAGYARSLGLGGLELREPERIVETWQQALSMDRPCVIDAHVDPEVPPLPPHIGFEQAKNFMFSVFKGDPSAGHMFGQSMRHLVSSLKPGQ